MRRLRKLVLAYLSEGTRVLDLVSNRETHIVKAFEHKGHYGFDVVSVKLWFDPDIHTCDGTGTTRSLSDIIVI